MSISVNNITKIYGTQKAVDGISFTVKKGEIVGFLGPNGAGKSTTMKMLTGYVQADAGEASIGGLVVTENNNETKKKIGYLPESNPLYNEMYVREYLRFIGNIHQVKPLETAVEKVIEMVGLKLESNKKIAQLSKGYKQRVGLAAALIHGPEVLILDEPTSGLDPNQIVEIRELIRRLGADKTVLFSSHILQEVEAICDRVIIINRGKIVADDYLQNLQQSNKSLQKVEVVFKERIEAAWIEKMEGVENYSITNFNICVIQTSQADLIKKQMMQLAIDQHLNIDSMKSNAQSLEDIFRELTNSKL
ncbi:MAG: gliding motility-associated ABC transporter ATP-binding subunit GldA [Chitinophagaceae bacterium]